MATSIALPECSNPPEYEERETAPGPGLPVALLLSLLLHASLGLAAYYWYQSRPVTDPVLSTTVFSLLLTGEIQREGVQREASGEAGPAAPAPEVVEMAPAPVEQPAPETVAVAVAATPQTATRVTTESTTTAKAATEVPQETDPAPDAPANPLVTLSPGELLVAMVSPESRTRAPSPEAPLLTPRQKADLRQQMQHWETDLDKLLDRRRTTQWESDDQLFTARVQPVPPADGTGLETAIVTVSTRVNGQTVSTDMAFKRLAFSHYAQLVNRWDPDVLISRDEIHGRFHSNTAVQVAASEESRPVFSGKVTVASRVNMRRRSQREAIFPGGLETFAERIRLPKQLTSLHRGTEQVAAEQVVSFAQDAAIRFLPDGGFSWHRLKDKSHGGRGQLHDSGHYFLAQKGVELEVQGRVHGSAVVYSPDRIVITGNLTYRDDPRHNPESNDYLSLLSDKYVEVAPPKIIGPGDLAIHGAIFAKRRFRVRRFNNRNKGVMDILGSVTAGSLSATEPRYATRLTYDERFETRRPLHFPMTGRYALDHWDARWTADGR